MSEAHEAGLRVADEMFSDEVAAMLRTSVGPDAPKGFGASLGDIALRNVLGEFWTRPGLDRRTRSLVTVGMLVALRQTDELKIHLPAALRNGCTAQEIEEVLYHACAYAGFPAGSHALGVAREVLKQNGSID